MFAAIFGLASQPHRGNEKEARLLYTPEFVAFILRISIYVCISSTRSSYD
jgi:hypothetical protein